MAARKQVTIHYRKFAGPKTYAEPTLEAAIRSAMLRQDGGVALADRYALRIWTDGEDNLFVNHYVDGTPTGNSLVFGDVLHFTKGHLQALFDAGQKDCAFASVEQMPAPGQKEYVHSLMYWMVKGDHVFVIQSTSLKTDSLESYLGWLLGTKTNVSTSSSALVLASKFDEAVVGGDLSDIQELVIGGVATPAPTEAEGEATQERVVEVTENKEIGTTRKTGWQQAREILSTLLGGSANVQSILGDVPKDAELSVEVHIGFKTKKRKVSRDCLKNLETGLRNLPDSQLHVKAKGGKKSADGSIRLHHPASILLRDIKDGNAIRPGSLLDPQDVLRAMVEAYDVFWGNGKISDNGTTE